MLTKMKNALLFLFLCFGHGIAQADHPIFFLLTHPRSTGTAFEKIMRTHGDMVVLHQPFLPPYLLGYLPKNHQYRKSLPPEVTYDDIKNHLFQLAETSPVFFKEQGYMVIDYLKANPDFLRHPQVKFAFLIRDPAKSILSYYRKLPVVDNSIIGHEQLWELFVMLQQELGTTPIVIDSDELLKHPLPILSRLGESWGLQFTEKDLQWDKGYADDWVFQEWYVEISDSIQLESYRGDVLREDDGTPKYLEVNELDARRRLQNIFRYQNVYYQKLLEHAVRL